MSPLRFSAILASMLTLLAASAPLSFLGCSSDDAAFSADYEAALQRVKDGADPLSTLVALDQRYPKQLSLKREIAAMLISNNQIEAAESYLAAIEKLAPARDSELNAAVAGVRARIALARSRWDDALSLSEKALKLDPADAAGAMLTKGRALAALGKADGAIDAFKAAFSSGGEKASADDWMAYIALQSDKDPAEALALFARYDTAFPYEPGLGLIESALREKLGDMEGAVYAVFRDIEYARSLGAIDAATASGRLDQIDQAIVAMDGQASRGGKLAVAACRSYLRGEWPALRDALAPNAGNQFMARWLKEVAAMRLQAKTMDQLKDYASLAGELSDLPSYWYHLTVSLERPTSGAAPSDLKQAAELCLDASPEGPYAADAKAALARALGLGAESSPFILTKRGIELIGTRSVNGGGAEVLEPIYGLLGLGDNEYTLYALGMMKGLASDPFYRRIFSERLKLAKGRLVERLSYILSE